MPLLIDAEQSHRIIIEIKIAAPNDASHRNHLVTSLAQADACIVAAESIGRHRRSLVE
jgi:hypothetical protein